MFDLHLVAQATTPAPVQAIPLWQLVIGVVTVILAIIGFVWRAARTLTTKDDLAALSTENEKVLAGITENVMENRRQIQKLDTSMRSIDSNLAFLAGRQHERDRHDLDWAVRPAARDDARPN